MQFEHVVALNCGLIVAQSGAPLTSGWSAAEALNELLKLTSEELIEVGEIIGRSVAAIKVI